MILPPRQEITLDFFLFFLLHLLTFPYHFNLTLIPQNFQSFRSFFCTIYSQPISLSSTSNFNLTNSITLSKISAIYGSVFNYARRFAVRSTNLSPCAAGMSRSFSFSKLFSNWTHNKVFERVKFCLCIALTLSTKSEFYHGWKMQAFVRRDDKKVREEHKLSVKIRFWK